MNSGNPLPFSFKNDAEEKYFMNSLHLSQFPKDTYIFLKAEARIKLFNLLETKFGSLVFAGRGLNIAGGELYSWRNGFSEKKKLFNKKIKRYIPLPALKKICTILNISVDSLEQQVELIKAGSRAGTIKNPSLPLEIKPETFALLGHFLGDGYGGEEGNACYVNKSNEAIENFVKKLKIAFGEVEYNLLPKHYRVIVPKIIPKILKKYFEIDDFRTGKAKLSQKLLDSPNKYLIEFLKALIIDEGSVSDSGIYLEFSPKALLTPDLKKICEKLGYPFHSGKYFILSQRSLPKIIKDMDDLVVPQKQELLLHYLRIKDRKWYNQKRGTTKKEILRLLSNKSMTVKEMALSLGIQQASVRTQLRGYNMGNTRVAGLLNQGLVEVKNLGWRNAAIFGLKSNN